MPLGLPCGLGGFIIGFGMLFGVVPLPVGGAPPNGVVVLRHAVARRSGRAYQPFIFLHVVDEFPLVVLLPLVVHLDARRLHGARETRNSATDLKTR